MAVRGRFEHLTVHIVLWVIVACLIGAVIFMMFAVWDAYEKERTARIERRGAEALQVALDDRQVALEARISHLETERGVEEVLRERFLVTKEGEEVIILVDAPEPPLDTLESSRKSIWETMKGWFSFSRN